jgi:alpha-amylase
MGVKVYPPQEAIFTNEWPQNGEINPWYFLYQPISYKLNSRMGTRTELRDMIETCRAANVRVYADAVVNHMTGGGNDVWPEHRNGGNNFCATWGAKDSTGDSPYYTHDYMFQNSNNTGERPGLEFPGVPYNPTDFHCERSLSSWNDPFQLNYGWLVGLSDLNTESVYVQERIAAYFTDLLSIGFSGFRIDAAKHIQPADLSLIFAKFKKNMGGGDLPDDFVTYLEVILGGEGRMLMCEDGDYNFGTSFNNKMKAAGLSDSDIGKVKIWSSDYPKEMPICGNWVMPSERYAIQNDCHDDQNPGSSSRDMQDKGTVLVRSKNVQ